MRIALMVGLLCLPIVALAQLPVSKEAPQDQQARERAVQNRTLDGSADCLQQMMRTVGGFRLRIGNDVFALDTSTVRVGMAGHDMQLRCIGVDLAKLFSTSSTYVLAPQTETELKIDAKNATKGALRSLRIMSGPIAGVGSSNLVALQCIVHPAESKRDETSATYVVDVRRCLTSATLVRMQGMARDVKVTIPAPLFSLDEVRTAFTSFTIEPASPEAWRQLALLIDIGLIPWQRANEFKPDPAYDAVRDAALKTMCSMFNGALTRSVQPPLNATILKRAQAIACQAGSEISTEYLAVVSHSCLQFWNGLQQRR